MEKISWTDRAKNEEVLHEVKEERNIMHTTKKGKVNWIGKQLNRKCLLNHVTEGKVQERIEVMRLRGRKRKHLSNNFNETRRYWKLKEEALDRTL